MDQGQMLLAGGLVVACVGAVAYVVMAPSNNARVAKRVTTVAGGTRRVQGTKQTADASKDRSKRVMESLRAIDEKAKEKKPRESLQQRLEQAGLTMTPRDFYIASLITAIIMAAVGFFSGQSLTVTGLMTIVGGLGLPRWALGMLRKRRRKKFLLEFSNALDIIVRGVRSGLPVNDCMKIIATEGRPPVGEEFHLVCEGIRLGLSLEQSLDRMVRRMPLQEVNFFAIVLVIQQKTGGNLAEALANLSKVIRARKLMEGKIKALSAEAQASALIIGSLPFLVMGMVQMMSPDYLIPLFETRIGNLILLGAGIWMSTGILVMKNMIAIKV